MSDDTIDAHKIFPTLILIRRLPGSDALNDQLKSVIAQHKAAHAGINRSNILGWHSDTEMLKWGGEAAKTLGLETLKTCGQHTTDIGMMGDVPRFEMAMEMWANVSPTGASNQNHAHPGSLWSAVYYVDDGGDPDSGPLVLQDPRFPMSRAYAPDLVFTDEEGTREENQFRIAPTPGKLVLFPSWLMHGVRPHKGSGARISIAMNIMAIPVRSTGLSI